MQPSDFVQFRQMIALTAEQYGKTMSPELIRFYFDGLNHLPLEAVRSALNRHVRNTDTGQFMPKIADIIRACEGGGDDAAFRALNTLNNAFSIGAWASVRFTDPVIALVVHDMGGWQALCERNAEEWTNFGSKEFLRRYRAYRDSPALPHIPDVFIGRIDAQNSASGYAEQSEPVTIGEARRKRLQDHG